jgi:hypothetical protein
MTQQELTKYLKMDFSQIKELGYKVPPVSLFEDYNDHLGIIEHKIASQINTINRWDEKFKDQHTLVKLAILEVELDKVVERRNELSAIIDHIYEL